jgi:HK97 family phage prohead protease
MNKIEQFKRAREGFDRHIATPVDETRSRFEVEDRVIKGYPIVWNERNDYGEVVLKGATLNSLNARGVNAGKNPIVVLNQHRNSEILCRPSVLQEDEYGLYFEGTVIEGTRYADEALAQIRQGVLRQMSYGFGYIWDRVEYDDVTDSFILKEIKLWEISVVTFSSGESAQLRDYRERQERMILDQYTPGELSGLQRLLASRAATSTREDAGGDAFTRVLKLF